MATESDMRSMSGSVFLFAARRWKCHYHLERMRSFVNVPEKAVPEKEWPDLTMTAGPCGLSQSVLHAMSQPMVYHYDPKFLRLFSETTEKLKKILLTQNDVLIMQGDAVLALEAAAHSCIKPGDKCLNLVSGHYGKGYEGYISANGGTLVEVAVPYDASVTVEAVERAIQENPDIKVLSMVHSETPSCTVNPVREICRLAKKHGILTIVDSVSGVGSCEVRVDDWGIDICVVGSQKCSGCAGAQHRFRQRFRVGRHAGEKSRKMECPVYAGLEGTVVGKRHVSLHPLRQSGLRTGCGGGRGSERRP